MDDTLNINHTVTWFTDCLTIRETSPILDFLITTLSITYLSSVMRLDQFDHCSQSLGDVAWFQCFCWILSLEVGMQQAAKHVEKRSQPANDDTECSYMKAFVCKSRRKLVPNHHCRKKGQQTINLLARCRKT